MDRSPCSSSDTSPRSPRYDNLANVITGYETIDRLKGRKKPVPTIDDHIASFGEQLPEIFDYSSSEATSPRSTAKKDNEWSASNVDKFKEGFYKFCGEVDRDLTEFSNKLKRELSMLDPRD